MTPLDQIFCLNAKAKIQKDKFILSLLIETVKIISAVCFLNYLSYSFFKQPNWGMIQSIQIAPLYEEIFFRGLLNYCDKSFNYLSCEMSSTLDLSTKDNEDENLIKIHPSVIEESIYKIYQFIFKCMDFLKVDQNNKIAEEKRKATFKVHCVAFFFSVAHLLMNPNNNQTTIIYLFASRYFNGLVYGHLHSKYHSLAPGIIVHGINNLIFIVDGNQGSAYIAYLANKIGSYILAVSSIDQFLLHPAECWRNLTKRDKRDPGS